MITVIIVVGLGLTFPARAQELSPATQAYHALLHRYASGDHAGAADAAAAMDVDESRRVLTMAIEEASRELRGRALLGAGRILRLRSFRLRLLVHSTLLHTDAAVRSPAPMMLARLDLARHCIKTLLDIEATATPLKMAPEPGLLMAPPPDDVKGRRWLSNAAWPSLRTFAWQWYRASTSLLQAADFTKALHDHLDEGLGLFPDDPDLLLARGSLREFEAELRVIDPSLTKTIYTEQWTDRTRVLLLGAVHVFEQALEHDPQLYEASLRLGRVRQRLGHHDRAAAALDAASAEAAPLFVRYLAALFAGELAEKRADAATAQRSYAQALDLLPNAQAPMLGLSHVCGARGDTACARAWLVRSMNAAKPGREDYFWSYRRGQTWRLEERFTELRRQGLQ